MYCAYVGCGCWKFGKQSSSLFLILWRLASQNHLNEPRCHQDMFRAPWDVQQSNANRPLQRLGRDPRLFRRKAERHISVELQLWRARFTLLPQTHTIRCSVDLLQQRCPYNAAAMSATVVPKVALTKRTEMRCSFPERTTVLTWTW